MKPYPWPGDTRCVVFVSVNFDAEAFDLKTTTEDRLYGRFSYGRYGVRAGLPRHTRIACMGVSRMAAMACAQACRAC